MTGSHARTLGDIGEGGFHVALIDDAVVQGLVDPTAALFSAAVAAHDGCSQFRCGGALARYRGGFFHESGL
jgi:hypothetical protein